MKPKPSVGRPGPEVSGSPRIRPRPIPPGTTWRNRTPDVGRRTSDTSAPTSATEEGTFTLGSSPTFRHPRRVLPSGSVSARTGPLAVPVPGSAGPTSTSVPQCTPSGGPSVPGRIPAPQPVASAVSPGRPRRHLHSIPSADRGDPRTRGSGLGLTVRSSPRVRSGDATDLVPAPPYRSSAVPAPLSSPPLASGAVGGVGGGREEGCRPIDLRSVPFRSAPFSLRSRPTGVSATPPSPESRGSGDRVGRTGPHGAVVSGPVATAPPTYTRVVGRSTPVARAVGRPASSTSSSRPFRWRRRYRSDVRVASLSVAEPVDVPRFGPRPSRGLRRRVRPPLGSVHHHPVPGTVVSSADPGRSLPHGDQSGSTTRQVRPVIPPVGNRSTFGDRPLGTRPPSRSGWRSL